jgi:hypothetical protein
MNDQSKKIAIDKLIKTSLNTKQLTENEKSTLNFFIYSYTIECYKTKPQSPRYAIQFYPANEFTQDKSSLCDLLITTNESHGILKIKVTSKNKKFQSDKWIVEKSINNELGIFDIRTISNQKDKKKFLTRLFCKICACHNKMAPGIINQLKQIFEINEIPPAYDLWFNENQQLLCRFGFFREAETFLLNNQQPIPLDIKQIAFKYLN